MRYRLRTVLILMAVGPPTIAVLWWVVTDFEYLVTFGAFLLMVAIIVVCAATIVREFKSPTGL